MGKVRLLIAAALLVSFGCVTAGVVVPLPRPSASASGEFAPPFETAWVRCLRPDDEPIEIYPFELSEPVYVAGRIIVGSRSKKVWCLDAASGERLWEFETFGPVESTAAVSKGVVYIGDDAGYLYALDLKTGAKLWSYRTPEGEVVDRVAATDNYVAFATDAHSLIMLSASGDFLWMHSVAPPSNMNVRGAGSPVFYGDLVIAGFSDGTLRAFEAATGKPAWRLELKTQGEMKDVDSDPTIVGDILFSAAYRGHIYAIDLKGASVLWRYPAGSVAAPAIGGGKVFFATDDGELVALEISTGKEVWKIEVAGIDKRSAFVRTRYPSFATAPVYHSGYLLFGTSRGNFAVVDAESGKLEFKRYLSTSISARPLVAGGAVFVHTDQDCLYSFVP